MEAVYIFLIVLGIVYIINVLIEPIARCYYKCFPRKREYDIEVYSLKPMYILNDRSLHGRKLSW